MIKLRPYQLLAVDGAMEKLRHHESTLISMPTGTGKTTVFCEFVSRRLPKRALILVHRKELLEQAASRISTQLGISCDIEMGNIRATKSVHRRSQVVVAMIQSITSGDRMFNFLPRDFGTIIIDECHTAVSSSYRQVIDFFKLNPEIKILGVTATPDRSDEEALGQVFGSVAFHYEILDAIHDGWLVPIKQQMVEVEGLDYSHMRTTAGDLNGGDLAELMEREDILQRIASSSIEIIGDKRTLAFTSSVKHAEMLCEIFNRHRVGMAAWVCGKTPKDRRSELVSGFRNGDFQVMVNCGVFTEGFDCPEVECIIQGRPTKSRALYTQIVGRGLRSWPLDPFKIDDRPTAEERKECIKSSPKPNALILDFVGNAGRHKLVTTADLLGGKVSGDAVDRVKKKAEESGIPVDMAEALEEEEERIRKEIEDRKVREEARRSRLIAKAKFRKFDIDPFNIYGIERPRETDPDLKKTLSQKQKDMIMSIGLDPDTMTYGEAKSIINEQFRRWKHKLCTMKQAKWLKSKGYDPTNISMKSATAIMDAWKRNGWRNPGSIAYENATANHR